MEKSNENNSQAYMAIYHWLEPAGHPAYRGRTPAIDMGSEYNVSSVGHTLHHMDMVGSTDSGFCGCTQDYEKELTKPHSDLII
jgi:hypothetical protein